MEIIRKIIGVYRVVSKPEKHDMKTEETLFDEVTNRQYDRCHIDWGQDTLSFSR